MKRIVNSLLSGFCSLPSLQEALQPVIKPSPRLLPHSLFDVRCLTDNIALYTAWANDAVCADVFVDLIFRLLKSRKRLKGWVFQ
jgi:hypothetical protein